MRRAALLVCLALLSAPAGAAESVSAHMDAARAAHAKGDMARTAMELEAALTELHGRLGHQLAEFLPPVPAGWQAEAPEFQSLAASGGGMAVTRAYGKDETTLNATLVLDSPAVTAAAAQFEGAPQPNVAKVKVGAEDALLRWDEEGRNGEVLMVLGKRILLQIEGDNIASSAQLSDAAKGWNLAAIRKALPQ
jgi:hypothetical protein